MNNKHILPLLLIFPALFMIVTAQPILMVSASDDDDENQLANIPGGGPGIAVGEPNPNAGIPVEPDQGPGGGGQGACDPEDDQCGTPYPGGPPPPPPPTGSNTADSSQVGGIGSGQINQRAQGAVNEQLCSTIGGIGNRQCQQQATQGAQNLQDCTAIAGLGRANCIQSENPSGPDTCLTANGRPFICETGTGTSISGSGQAGQ